MASPSPTLDVARIMGGLSVQSRQAIELTLRNLAELESAMAGLDREGRSKWLRNHIAARRWDRGAQPAMEDGEGVARAAAISILAIALTFE